MIKVFFCLEDKLWGLCHADRGRDILALQNRWRQRSSGVLGQLNPLSCSRNCLVFLLMWITEKKKNHGFQGLSLASRILRFPRTCNMAYDIALSFCLLLLKALVQILPQASQNLLSSPHKSTCMSQHSVIYSSYTVISFCLLTCCCLRFVSLSFVNQLYFAYHLCFCGPLWKAINAHRFFMKTYCDIGRIFSSFTLIISSSAQEMACFGGRSTEHG